MATKILRLAWKYSQNPNISREMRDLFQWLSEGRVDFDDIIDENSSIVDEPHFKVFCLFLAQIAGLLSNDPVIAVNVLLDAYVLDDVTTDFLQNWLVTKKPITAADCAYHSHISAVLEMIAAN